VVLIPSIKYYMLQVGAHLNAGMPDNPLTSIAVASLTDMIKCLLEAGVDANIIAGGCRKTKLKVMNPEKEAKGYESSPVPDTIYCHQQCVIILCATISHNFCSPDVNMI
jgi:hypothetical protein